MGLLGIREGEPKTTIGMFLWKLLSLTITKSHNVDILKI